jgi:hypothetical protein
MLEASSAGETNNGEDDRHAVRNELCLVYVDSVAVNTTCDDDKLIDQTDSPPCQEIVQLATQLKQGPGLLESGQSHGGTSSSLEVPLAAETNGGQCVQNELAPICVAVNTASNNDQLVSQVNSPFFLGLFLTKS